jgi:hypothetical protein
VSTALLFPGAYDVSLSCPATTVESVVLFLQLLAGCLLPLYFAYVGELAGKVRFVARWAAAQGLGVRGSDAGSRAASSAAGSGGGPPGSGSGGPDGSGEGDGDGSSRSGGSWRSSRSGGERGAVGLELRGPFALLELNSVSGGPVVAPRAHVAWVLLLTVLGWGVTSQAPLWLQGRGGGRSGRAGTPRPRPLAAR